MFCKLSKMMDWTIITVLEVYSDATTQNNVGNRSVIYVNDRHMYVLRQPGPGCSKHR